MRSNPEMKGLFLGSVLSCLILACSPGVAWAAGAEAGKGEVTGYGGGVHIGEGGGTHGIAGASAGANLTGMFHVFGEFNYVPLGSASLDGTVTGGSISAKASAKVIDFGGGLHVNFAQKGSKVVPYVTGAFGVGYQSLKATGTGVGPGTIAKVDLSESSMAFYAGGGGGVKLFVNDRWGLRPEFRYQRYTGDDSANVLFFTFGVFYQFGR